MKPYVVHAFSRLRALLLAAALGLTYVDAAAQDTRAFSQPQLDQLLAPVALYPDPLLSQMLMAATYPLEVAEAAGWSHDHPGVQGEEAVRAVDDADWDESVKSLVAFPQVLAWMEENPQWTQAVGEAFLVQEPQVMETVQNLRRKAQSAGTLRSDERVHVLEETNSIAVYPANPQIVYLLYYDPLVVYGTWWWPDYPPVRWHPWPGYSARPGPIAPLYWGPPVGLSARFFFGGFDWPHRQMRVLPSHRGSRSAAVREPPGRAAANQEVWRHDPSHRRGLGYRDPALQRRFAVEASRSATPDASPAPPQALSARTRRDNLRDNPSLAPPPRTDRPREGTMRPPRDSARSGPTSAAPQRLQQPPAERAAERAGIAGAAGTTAGTAGAQRRAESLRGPDARTPQPPHGAPRTEWRPTPQESPRAANRRDELPRASEARPAVRSAAAPRAEAARPEARAHGDRDARRPAERSRPGGKRD